MVVRKYTKNNSFYRKNYNFVEPGFVPITATGGTITSAGPYMIHTFTSNGTFTITQGSYQEIDYFTIDRKSTRLNSSHVKRSRMPSSA